MQGVISVILIALMWMQRGDRQALALYGVTLIVPLGWAFALWSAWQRDAAARREGRASKEFLAAERKRSMGIMGGVMVAWVALAILVVAVL